MSSYLASAIRQFEAYKRLGERAMEKVTDEQLDWRPNAECNSITVIVKHLSGNMISRWTDFLTTDGEKPWRERDNEFVEEATDYITMEELFDTLQSLTDADLDKTVLIRGEEMTAMDAIIRQVAHYSCHVGQIIYIAKVCSTQWEALTIPRNGSAAFNAGMMGAK
ncbi:MAG: DUF1572 domain-containing protein [Chitinophagia bacterium]|nr:DUF1572 domain-containing protein [Chitinophagia bacterium]